MLKTFWNQVGRPGEVWNYPILWLVLGTTFEFEIRFVFCQQFLVKVWRVTHQFLLSLERKQKMKRSMKSKTRKSKWSETNRAKETQWDEKSLVFSVPEVKKKFLAFNAVKIMSFVVFHTLQNWLDQKSISHSWFCWAAARPDCRPAVPQRF